MLFLLQNKKIIVKLNHTDKSLMVFHKVYQHFFLYTAVYRGDENNIKAFTAA